MGNRGIEPRTLALGLSRFGGGKALMITLVLGSGLLAAVVLNKTRCDFQECRLARTIAADKRDPLAWGHNQLCTF